VSNASLYWNSPPAKQPTLDRIPKYPKPDTFKDALYLIMIGANDYGYYFGRPLREFDSMVSNATGSILSTIKVSMKSVTDFWHGGWNRLCQGWFCSSIAPSFATNILAISAEVI
jgi:hypothetical protein